jgi:2',3'-cyclic-nucleotide 2'-phosphodiesterase (5'-nucleotidase family)
VPTEYSISIPRRQATKKFFFLTMTKLAQLRLVAINDVYSLSNFPKFQTFLKKISPTPVAVCLAGDFLSPSPLSSIDGGRGMVATLRAVGISHVCFGNHEADLSLGTLHERMNELTLYDSVTVLNSNMRRPPPNAAYFQSQLEKYSLVKSHCNRVRVALMGLMSDERGMYRNNTFKGVPIDDMTECFDDVYNEVIPTMADLIIPLTHASMWRDQELASHMAKVAGSGVIIGGHEHDPLDVTVEHSSAAVRILKSGTEARAASLIDLYFDPSRHPARLEDIHYDLVDLHTYEDSVVVAAIVESHQKVLEQMSKEVIADCSNFLPPGQLLDSQRTRFQQTTMGSFLCQAIKEEMEADVAVINGASIKGNSVYDSNQMTYEELRRELPFPTRMVVVPMTRAELESGIHYSRTYTEDGRHLVEGEDSPRRGFLQVDMDYDLSIPYHGNEGDIVHVALPRNLLNGFCKIVPLMEVGQRLKQEGVFPGEDDFVPALDLVVRYCSKHRWSDILVSAPSFDDLDLNHDGVLDRHEIKLMMKKYFGREPPEFVIDDMIASVDADDNGVIDAGEFSYLLATAEREQRW